MKHTFLSRCCLPLYILGIHLLVGCATQQTIPIVVIYDRALDNFHVETEAVPQDETPVYPDTLGFITLIDGERHEGLIPRLSAYDYNMGHKSKPLWRGPYWVQYKDSKWRMYRAPTTLPNILNRDKRVVVQTRINAGFSPPYPVYLFQIDGAYHHITR